jgi:hypothetical protein
MQGDRSKTMSDLIAKLQVAAARTARSDYVSTKQSSDSPGAKIARIERFLSAMSERRSRG